MSCGDFDCNAGGTACLTTCTSDNHCATTARPYCDGGACVSGRVNGARCQTAAECASQRCVDGYCCNDACQAPCQACDVAGHLGACSPVPSGTPYGGRPSCGGVGSCAGFCNNLASGQCFLPGAERSCVCAERRQWHLRRDGRVSAAGGAVHLTRLRGHGAGLLRVGGGVPAMPSSGTGERTSLRSATLPRGAVARPFAGVARFLA